MAILSKDGSYVTVEKGDTLWGIAEKHLGAGIKYKELAQLNNLDNPNLIRVGQKIYLKSQQTQDTSKDSPEKVTIKEFGLMSDSDSIGAAGDTLFATWRFALSNKTEHYQVQWKYKNIIEIYGADTTTTYTYSTYTIDSKAKNYVKFRVKPIAKKDDEGKSLYESTWTSWKEYSLVEKPVTPSSAPSLSVSTEDNLSLTLSVNGLTDKSISLVYFEIVKDDSTVWKTNLSAKPTETGVASYTIKGVAGYSYKARYKIRNQNGVESDWSPYNDQPVYTAPAKIDKITECVAISDKAIKLTWPKSGNADGYEIQYTANDIKNFDNGVSLNTASPEGTNTTITIENGISSGNTYYFRVKAKRGELETEWSEIASTSTESDISAPTTWSSKTNAIVNEDEYVYLYWVHNSADGSSQKFAEIELTIEEGPDDLSTILEDLSVEIGELDTTKTSINDENKTVFFVINNSEDKKEKDKIHSVGLKISDIYDEGAKIEWKIRTAGITGVQSEEWSVIREIDVYAKPELSFYLENQNSETITDNLITAFPFTVNISLDTFNSNLQNPIGYHIIVKANEGYDTTDNIGNSKRVSEGEYLYSKYFDNPQNSKSFSVTLGPSDLSLENGYEYTVTGIVSMSSGITSEISNTYTVSWEGSTYNPNVEVKIDTDNYIAYLRPYCSEFVKTLNKVTYDGVKYTKTGDTVVYVYGNLTSNTFTATGERVFYTTDINGRKTYYCEVEVGESVEYYQTIYIDGIYHKDLLSKINKNYIIGTPVSNAYTDDGELVYYGLADNENSYYCEVVTETQITDVLLSVYRHENDGTFTEIMSGIDGGAYAYVVDPHPNLNYVKYRIVATDKSTGRISYTDTSSIQVGVKSIILQWDEQFTVTDEDGETDPAEQPWSGSLLKLPYNVDVSEKSNPDVSLINYIGRKYPVSYYGTQLGIAQSLNAVIEKDDSETLNALRRLQVWTGDVYVREPSGNGYWANVKVSFGKTHRELTIPVSIDVTRVEGGV